MKQLMRFPRHDRRALLSSLAMLPFLSAALRSTSAMAQTQTGPLPSWNEGPTKASIVDFVARVTESGGAYFFPPPQPTPTLHHHRTPLIEQPLDVQLALVLDLVQGVSPIHPRWKDKQ